MQNFVNFETQWSYVKMRKDKKIRLIKFGLVIQKGPKIYFDAHELNRKEQKYIYIFLKNGN